MRSSFLALDQGARAFLLEVWPVASAEDVRLGARFWRMRSAFLALDRAVRSSLGRAYRAALALPFCVVELGAWHVGAERFHMSMLILFRGVWEQFVAHRITFC